jgi:hypothetical protein
MNTKISMKRIFFILYVFWMIFLTWMPNINQIALLICLLIWVILYFSRNFTFTYKVYSKVSFIYWIFFGILNWMPRSEEPSWNVYIWEFIIYWILFLLFIGLLYIDIKSNKKAVN